LACASETFDLVLMDLQMPEMDGFAATREIRASGNEVPVVAVTASAMIGERERCLSAGMNDYLSKPIDRRALEEMLEKWLAADQGSTSSR
jgi:CheY-like chemotaxis protein